MVTRVMPATFLSPMPCSCLRVFRSARLATLSEALTSAPASSTESISWTLSCKQSKSCQKGKHQLVRFDTWQVEETYVLNVVSNFFNGSSHLCG